MRQLDVRILLPSQKHSTIHRCLERLGGGDTLRILCDHDPRPLRYELDEDYPDSFLWSYVENGPQVWCVDIVKKKEMVRQRNISMLADCQSLSVSEIRVLAGASESLASLGGTVAIICEEGEGTVTISGCLHSLQKGSVEVICPGESCTISAKTDVRAYLVLAKAAREK